MRTLLAQSKHYRIYRTSEDAELEGPGLNEPVWIGGFYGDVECACIDQNEQWCITAGDGLVIYYLRLPFEPYKADHQTEQWKELWRGEKSWYPEIIYQIDAATVRIVNNVYSENKGE